MIEDKLTYRIIGCAMKVHNILGCGFQEVIYQRALALEFDRARIVYGREVEHSILYQGEEIGSRRADFVVESRVVVELKALTVLESVHVAQARNYLEAYDYEIGLLINFGAESLECKRLFNTKE